MKKFVLTVDAEQWDGKDHPEVIVDRDAYLGFMAGHSFKGHKIREGEWMVKFPNGTEMAMSNSTFISLYKPYYGSLPVDQELARLYNSVSELDNEVVRAKFGGSGH